MTRRRVALPAVAAVAACLAASGCGSNDPAETFRDKLIKAGYTSVTVEPDEESFGSRKKKKIVAYDFDWVVNTDTDAKTCTVELEHPGSASQLKGKHWHVDEVNGKDVNWGRNSPGPDEVRRLLRQHNYDC